MFNLRREIDEVFTPRNAEVNAMTYIDRPEHESELKRTLPGSLHLILCGYSGSGKSWLYKKVLAETDVTAIIANCANADRFSSLTEEIIKAVYPEGTTELDSVSEGKSATINAAVASAELKSEKVYIKKAEDPLLKCFKTLREKARKSIGVIVLDNFEFMLNNEKLMKELASIIILGDDIRYASYGIKLLIVGVPNDIIDYFLRTDNLSPVANRLHELKEVRGLTEKQVRELITKGFITYLNAKIDKDVLTTWCDHIYKVTLGVAQYVQEYCKVLAYITKDNKWIGTTEQLSQADSEWLNMRFKNSYATIDSLISEHNVLNTMERLLYSLGQIEVRNFTIKDVEQKFKREFPRFSRDRELNIENLLLNISQNKNPILRKNPRVLDYEFINPRDIMCIRVMLKKEPKDETISRLGFKL